VLNTEFLKGAVRTALREAGFDSPPQTGLLPNGAVPVDKHLRTPQGFFAAGDIAAYPHDGEVVNVEHWAVALQQGRHERVPPTSRT
jgi:hypothetical protein